MRKIKYTLLSLALFSSLTLASEAPPDATKKKLTLQDLINNTTGSSQRTTTVAGVRGLEETNGEVDTKARDFAAIERLEQTVIHEDELKRFMEEGKLH